MHIRFRNRLQEVQEFAIFLWSKLDDQLRLQTFGQCIQCFLNLLPSLVRFPLIAAGPDFLEAYCFSLNLSGVLIGATDDRVDAFRTQAAACEVRSPIRMGGSTGLVTHVTEKGCERNEIWN